MTPRLLFAFAYESHGFLFVELDDEADAGGTVVEWGYGGQPFYVRFAAVQRLRRPARDDDRARQPHPIDEDVRHWPEHWLASSGFTPEVRTPRGASTTIAKLVRAATTGDQTNGTIHATVTRLAGSSSGARVTLDDGTGVLDVWCPAAVCAFGPAMRRRFDFDVVVKRRSSEVEASAIRPLE